MRALIPILLLLGGCAFDPVTRAAWHDDQCREYGYEYGTEGYADCRLALELAWQERVNATLSQPPQTQLPQSQQPVRRSAAAGDDRARGAYPALTNCTRVGQVVRCATY